MTTPNLPRVQPGPVTALVAATVVAASARRLRALSPGGALAASAIGGAILTGAGLRGAVATITFFVSSTLLGRLSRPPGRQQRRGNERDAVQVLANGATAAALALAARNSGKSRLLLSGFAGALATATADTWATEIGSRASTRPRSIVTGRSVPAGTSGAVSLAGLLASAAGALSIGAITSVGASRGHAPSPTHGWGSARAMAPRSPRRSGSSGSSGSSPRPSRSPDPARAPLLAVVLGGFCGALTDSVLGATAQEVRLCPICGAETEMSRHGCGTPTITVRGISRFDNDAVNFVSTLAGAATTMILTMRSDHCPMRDARGGPGALPDATPGPGVARTRS